jgi:multidrug efflux pump subunit AcrA (membrane-fusion protein)
MGLRAGKKNGSSQFPGSQVSWAAIQFSRQPHHLMSQLVIYLVCAIFAGGLIYSLMVQIAITVEATGVLTSEKRPVPIRSPSKITVAELNVVENQTVRAGQILVKSSENLSSKDLNSFREYVSRLSAIRSIYGPACAKCPELIRGVTEVYLRIEAKGEIQTVISPVQDLLRELSTAHDEHQAIFELTADNRMQIKNAQIKLAEIKRRKAMKLLAKEVEALTTEITTNQTRVNERVQRSTIRMSNLRNQLQARISELVNRLDYLGSVLTITAPFDGTVSNLKIKGPGELLQSGEVLLEIVPIGTKLVAELNLENKDVSMINPGMLVQVAIDAMPEFDYGTVGGKVLSISRSDATLQDNSKSQFVVAVALDQQFLSSGNERKPFMLGMTVRGRIITRYESLLIATYRALFQIQSEIRVHQ